MELTPDDYESVRRILGRLAEESVICAGRELGVFYDELGLRMREQVLGNIRSRPEPFTPQPQAEPAPTPQAAARVLTLADYRRPQPVGA